MTTDANGAQHAWPRLPEALQNRLSERLSVMTSVSERQLASELADALWDCLLQERVDLAASAEHANPLRLEQARAKCRKGVQRFVGAMNTRYPDTPYDYFFREQARQLWLAAQQRDGQQETPEQPQDTLDVLTRHYEQLLEDKAARERAYRAMLEHTAHALYLAIKEDLAAEVGNLLGAAKNLSWLYVGPEILLSVDYISLSCAAYLAGKEKASSAPQGFDELPSAYAGRVKRAEAVTVKVVPEGEGASTESMQDRPEHLTAPPSELKAKAYVLLLALAAEAHAQREDTQRFCVRLKDLMGALGYRLGRRTNARYYWRYAAELVRYLLIDLPSRVAAMQLTVPDQRESLIVYERLLCRFAPIIDPISEASEFSRRLMQSVQCGDEQQRVSLVRDSKLLGLELGLSQDMLRALGIVRPMNALERVPVELLALKGPAFWLAWHVAFLRRWASFPISGRSGQRLLKLLEVHGYLARSRRGGKQCLKEALQCCWQDIGRLVDMGLLEEPGMRLYSLRGGAWRDVSGEFSQLLDPGGGRLTEERLAHLRAILTIPKARLEQLSRARKQGAARRR